MATTIENARSSKTKGSQSMPYQDSAALGLTRGPSSTRASLKGMELATSVARKSREEKGPQTSTK
jgi:hypothetical protein